MCHKCKKKQKSTKKFWIQKLPKVSVEFQILMQFQGNSAFMTDEKQIVSITLSVLISSIFSKS